MGSTKKTTPTKTHISLDAFLEMAKAAITQNKDREERRHEKLVEMYIGSERTLIEEGRIHPLVLKEYKTYVDKHMLDYPELIRLEPFQYHGKIVLAKKTNVLEFGEIAENAKREFENWNTQIRLLEELKPSEKNEQLLRLGFPQPITSVSLLAEKTPQVVEKKGITFVTLSALYHLKTPTQTYLVTANDVLTYLDPPKLFFHLPIHSVELTDTEGLMKQNNLCFFVDGPHLETEVTLDPFDDTTIYMPKVMPLHAHVVSLHPQDAFPFDKTPLSQSFVHSSLTYFATSWALTFELLPQISLANKTRLLHPNVFPPETQETSSEEFIRFMFFLSQKDKKAFEKILTQAKNAQKEVGGEDSVLTLHHELLERKVPLIQEYLTHTLDQHVYPANVLTTQDLVAMMQKADLMKESFRKLQSFLHT